MKSCPRCKALTFDDMDVCYSCMYRFAPGEGDGESDAADEMLGPEVGGNASAPHGNSLADELRRRMERLPSTASSAMPSVASSAVPSSALIELKEKGKPPRLIAMREGEQVLIGRSKSCSLVLGAPNVSRRHAMLSIEHGRLWIEDLGSTNATYLLGKPLLARKQMGRGDSFTICGASFKVLMFDTDSGQPVGGNAGMA